MTRRLPWPGSAAGLGAMALVAAIGMLTGCDSSGPADDTTSAAAVNGASDPAEIGGDLPGLPNVHVLSKKIISGAEPEGDLGFETLVDLGVKTVISVDGSAPDVARAEAHGLRYVHLPITYAEVTPEQQLEIARAIRDLPGPIYVHCHHGKHRAPAAAAAAAVNLGIISPAEGVEFMKTAGCSPSYSGLYACILEAHEAGEPAIDAAPNDFPPLQRAHGITAAMVEIDHAWAHLEVIKAAGWKVPDDHPDLVPAAEAGQLTDNLRFASEDTKAQKMGEDHMRRLFEAIQRATDLEEGIIRGEPATELDGRFELMASSCKECHGRYRNVRR